MVTHGDVAPIEYIKPPKAPPGPKPEVYKLVLAGDADVGKSTLMIRFIHGRCPSAGFTVGTPR
ncbi:hypothetical protein B0H10DRAFT_2071704 [Mycena sp. CBHHK59/15]|nr:hypothetical protein B0H10DRAFT_2071704 [Mycena sp. CBHHK59/15]